MLCLDRRHVLCLDKRHVLCLDRRHVPCLEKRQVLCLDKRHVLCLDRRDEHVLVLKTGKRYFASLTEKMRNAIAIKMQAVPCRDLSPEDHS